ncbi:uncharacterized protein [Mytilus edulis]|uniref:uncharacterized protein n=1 Tax=Mytilus edulis TaxID=6550 RepID=UPI0039F00244
MTNPNYHKAIELLRNRYGQPHKIINAYIRALLDIPAPHDTLESLRTFHDKSEAYIRGLESLGQCQDMYESLLIPVILGKIPHEVRKNITRENGSDSWNIQSLRNTIGKENAEWNYCPTDDNPADYLTRGIYAKHLYNNSLWMNGPQWILNRENWPTWTRKIEDCSTMVTVSDDNTDDKSTNASTQRISCIDIQRYRSLEKAIRVTAYVLRFIQNLRNLKDKRSIGFISVEERCKALKVIVTVQQETFKDEIESLNSSSQKKVPLVRQLKLYTDRNGLLRCTGRIQNAPVKESTKYPLLLPTHHSVTSLIVMDAHTKTLHAGLNSTIAYIQQKYWIPRIRQCVKSQIRKCVQCIKISGMPYNAPDPPLLPKDRVNYDYPFSVTGVDFTGALYTKENTTN